jgi:hypothetical protein
MFFFPKKYLSVLVRVCSWDTIEKKGWWEVWLEMERESEKERKEKRGRDTMYVRAMERRGGHLSSYVGDAGGRQEGKKRKGKWKD